MSELLLFLIPAIGLVLLLGWSIEYERRKSRRLEEALRERDALIAALKEDVWGLVERLQKRNRSEVKDEAQASG